jgi:hypothetical protein
MSLPRTWRAHEIHRATPLRRSRGAARKLVELANAFEPIQDGRIYIEKINGPFLFELKGTPAEYKAGLDCAIENGWLASLEQQIFRRAGKSHSIWSAELPRSMALKIKRIGRL